MPEHYIEQQLLATPRDCKKGEEKSKASSTERAMELTFIWRGRFCYLRQTQFPREIISRRREIIKRRMLYELQNLVDAGDLDVVVRMRRIGKKKKNFQKLNTRSVNIALTCKVLAKSEYATTVLFLESEIK
jgi:hypothetical protein